ncbi:DUF5666 domain-containing protein [Aquincola sp. MAHUQ-54]|uniref:DUF5666 domain-containing protein n=1 Tax=Aquincola agrisoli TaxID=3119538 RepID=A0AAW9QGK5_9BURK
MKHSLYKLAGTCLAAGALAACGGGGGGDDGSAAPQALATYASGAVHGLGPVQVNGARYDETGATVYDEAGAAVGAGALALGMVVEVHAGEPVTSAGGGQVAPASTIRYRSEIEGPVASVDAGAGVLTVLGQRIGVTPSTVFDDDLRGGLGRVRAGDVLEVYGFLDAAGAYVATRIEREDGDDPYKLRGAVQGLDTAAQTFRIGALTVSYAGLPAAAAVLADGATVRVELRSAPDAAGHWPATRVQGAAAAAGLPTGRVNSEIEGVVTAYAGPASFSVNGVAVDASQVARLPAGLGLGARVEVEGTLAGGVITAREVELDDDRDAGEGLEVSGAIERVDAAVPSFVVRGIEVLHAGARFEDGTAAQLAVGRQVEVTGVLSADGNTLQASEVEFD